MTRILQGCFGDQLVILDIARGDYVLLEPVAAQMWQVLSKRLPEVVALDRLAERFNAPRERLAADYAAFAGECAGRGWLTSTAIHGSSSPSPIISPMLTAACLVLRVRHRLKFRGFGETYRWAVDHAPTADSDVDPQRLARAERAFGRAEALLPNAAAPDDCLPRSLALFAFLRRMGLPAEHRIGVERMPFGAHAWVECDGRVILDDDRRAEYITLMPAKA